MSLSYPEMASIPADQKALLHQVADLLLEIYQTLAEMRYFHPSAIVRGPHDISAMRETYEKSKLDPAIIYLYSILPYIDESKTEARDFFQGGAFFNPFKEIDVERGRDPFYASPKKDDFDDEDGEYMYPWYTSLSNCGNHSPVIIFDARGGRIWVVEQIDRYSSDPFYRKGWYGEEAREENEEATWGDSDGNEWNDGETGSSDVGSDGSSEFWSDNDDSIDSEEIAGLETDQGEEMSYDEDFEIVEHLSDLERQEAAQVKNRNSLEPVLSRSAEDVLRDINRWYRELKELPGQGECSSGAWMTPEILRPVYRRHGWPDTFDGEAFEIDMARTYCAQRANYFAEEPLRRVKCHEDWAEHATRTIERCHQSIANASTRDEEWRARFELCKAEEMGRRNRRDLAEARINAERLCPSGECQKAEDLPLWELERLRIESEWKQTAVERSRNAMKSTPDGGSDQHKHMANKFELELRCAAIYRKAWEASAADAARLCPGRTFESVLGKESCGRFGPVEETKAVEKAIESMESQVISYCVFLSNIPDNVAQIQETVQKEIDQLRDAVQESRKRLSVLKEKGT